ncbi:MAG: hypothetical protein IPJ39_03010 [Saprospiraceae bacterium]|nr:hypothetical protein [Saprospiraceae bacterium]
MYYERLKNLEFEMEDDKLAVARVNKIQQPYFKSLQNGARHSVIIVWWTTW